MQFSKDYQRIIKNYRILSWVEKFIVWTRFQIVPIKEMVSNIPHNGKILDLGCGFGVFSYYIAFNHPNLSVIGLDPSGQRIERAKNTIFIPDNLKFYQGYLADFNESNFDLILMVDIICYLTEEQQIALIKNTYEKTKENGILIIKTMDKGHRFRYILMMSITKMITLFSIFSDFLPNKISAKIMNVFGQRKVQPHFYFSSEFKNLLEDAGWEVQINNTEPIIFPDIIYFCKKSLQSRSSIA